MAKHPNYELFEELGKSENSVVYRAYDLVLGRDVAIKELVSEPGSDGGQNDAKRIDRFLKEASFLAQFEHENVLRIHTVDQERGWIVMELMKGTLASQIARKPMPADTVRSVLRQILTALDFLHRKEKVHGAVRPSNILINEHGTVKLSDFEASSRDGELRAPKGSKKYLAPELIRADFGTFGPAVDLYCLGFTALELLTGKQFDSLFPGTGDGAINADVAWLRWHSSDDPMRSVKQIAPKVPHDLATVVDSLLQKSVDDRPQSAAEVLKALDDTPLVPVEVPEPAAPEAKHQNVGAMLPGKAVKLRDPAKPRKKTSKPESPGKPKQAATGKDRVNEILGKPFVLWPLCAGILIGALFLGLHLRGGDEPAGIVDKGQPVEPIRKDREPEENGKDSELVKTGGEPGTREPKIKLVDVELLVLPDANGTTLLIDGEPRSLNGLRLPPGEHQVLLTKTGFEAFNSKIDVSADSSRFEIALKAIPTEVVEGNKGTDPDRAEPAMFEVEIAVSPADAEVLIAGEPAEVRDGVLRIKQKDGTDLKIAATREGFKPKSEEWTWDELVAADYGMRLSLDKMAEPKVTPTIALPDSLELKAGADLDEETQLPTRVFVRALQSTSPLEMALVKAGDYRFGVPDGELRTWELAGRPLKVESPFYIGIEEVSNAQYAAFVDQVRPEYHANSDGSELPLTDVSIVEAAKFCDWAGGRLPTEEEWEAAVRGTDDSGYPLPWSGKTSDAFTNRLAGKCHLFDTQKSSDGTATMPTQPVTASAMADGANAIGLLNTIGNVSEWCDTPHDGGQFVIKGCSFRMPPGDHVRVTWRGRCSWKGAEDVGMRLMVPVAKETRASSALAFVAPTNIADVLAQSQTEPDAGRQQVQTFIYTKTVKEIADEFKGPAELVIDSGGFMDEITDVAFSPDGKLIAVAGGKLVRIWDIETGQLVNTLRGDMSRTSYGNVHAAEFSPDGEYMVVGVNDYRDHGNIRIYETANLDEIKELLPGHTAPCRKLCFSRDGKYLVSADSDGLVLIRDWESRQVLNSVPARNRDQPIFDAMTFPTAEPFMLGVDFEGPQVYSATTGDRLGGRDNMPARVRGWLVDVFNKLVKLPYGANVAPRVLDLRMDEGVWVGAGSAIENGRSRFWARVWESREPVSAATPAKELGAYDQHRWNITAIAMQPRGSLVASGDKFGEVHVWNYRTGKQLLKFAGQGKPIYEVAFDEGSQRLAFGTHPHTPKDWKRNNYGTASRVLDLRQRAIFDASSRGDLKLRNEQPQLGNATVSVKKNDAHYFVERSNGSQTESRYRISSGRNPTVYTLLPEPKLGVQQPVIFGDNEGLLALWDSSGDELKRAFIGHGSLVSAISPSSNGKLIATASTDRTIRLWSLEDYTPTGIFDFKFENSAVREVVPGSSSERAGVRVGDRIVSIDGKSLTEMFELMLLNKFDYKPGQTVPVTMKRAEETYQYDMTMADGYDFSEPVLSFYVGDDGQWIIWHPQGYYDASPGADRLIGWHLNRGPDKSATYFEVQQFRKKLYRPDVIDGILETGSLEGALARVDESQYEKEPTDFRDPEQIAENHPPGVQITYPVDRWATESAAVTVKGEAYSVNGLPVTAVTLLHNGSVAKVFRPTEVDQIAMLVEHEITLTPGQNDLVLIAANSKSSSQGEHIVVDLTGQRSMELPDALVLAIGVSEFPESLTQLPHAAADAIAFTSAVQSHEGGKLYGKVQTKLLKGRVSQSEILDGFQWLTDNAKDGDVVMVFAASHGLVDRRDNFYIATSNSNEAKARSTAVSWRDLTDTLQLDLPDCKRMVFLDLEPTKNALRPGMRSPLLDLAAPEMGTVFLSANTLQQQPSRTEGDNGAFMQAVLDTVRSRKFDTNPTPGDAMFNPVELAAGVTSRVKDLTRDQQQPVFFTPEFVKFTNVLELQD